jgi:thiosulfate reductase cytochrome b subunit
LDIRHGPVIRNIGKTGSARQYRLGIGSMPGRRRPAGAICRLGELAMSMTKPRKRVIHPWPLRVTHWLNAFAIIMMIGSGWQIYDASPLFGFTFPPLITIGGWLGAAIAWHLAFMWLLVVNGIAYLTWGAGSGHFAKLWPVSPRAVLSDIFAALRFNLRHEKGVYNSVQRLLYLGVILAGIVIVISGLAIWKPVQLWFFCNLCGGYFAARYVHFFAMGAIVAFTAIHVLLVIMVPKVLPPMITGGRLES